MGPYRMGTTGQTVGPYFVRGRSSSDCRIIGPPQEFPKACNCIVSVQIRPKDAVLVKNILTIAATLRMRAFCSPDLY